MTEEEKIDQLVSMLDNFMIEGGGHMNVETKDSSSTSTPNIEVSPSNECVGNKPCAIPNMKDDSIDKN